MAKKITANPFVEALVKAGIIDDPSMVTRVIIDVRPTQMVVVHVERIGDESLVDTVPALAESLGLRASEENLT